MTDLNAPVTDGPITPQPPTAPQGDAGESTQVEPQFVTKEMLDAQLAEFARRQQQSNKARAKQIEAQLEDIKSLLTKAGTPPTEQQEAAIRSQIAERLDDNDQEPEPEQASPDLPGSDPVSDFLNDIFAEAGASVNPTDPEWASIKKVLDETWNDPRGMAKVAAAATLAANAKKARAANMQETAAARVSVGGSSIPSGQPANAPASELWKAAYSKT